MLTPAQEDAFLACDATMALWRAAGGQRPLHLPEAVDLFVGLHEAGEAPDPDAVRAWFAAAGWDDADARELARIAETVARVLGDHDRAPRGRSGRAATPGTPSVLVAEDEGPVAAVLVDLLAEEGFAVRHARDGAEALAEIERDPPDLLISNVRTPGVDGVELARRAQEREAPIPVVLVGADGDGADVPGAVVVAKPFDRDRLLDVVRRTCRDRTPNERVNA